MRKRAIGLACGLALTASTCIIYTGNPARDPHVLDGRGMAGRVYWEATGAFLSGELLNGDSTGYLVIDAADGRVKWIPVALTREVWFPVWSLRFVIPKTPEQYMGLREASRFSYGMTAEALQSLLTAKNQPAVDTIRSASRATPARDDPATEFLATARKATERYRSSDIATADGFKRVGTEFPFMGEHWVNLPRVLENRFDVASPSILIYVVTAKGRELAGVGYSALLTHDQPPPAGVAPASAWHEHNGAVVDESLPGHGGNSHGPGDGMRLAVLHAWPWVANPAGAFVTDNETLPLLRNGTATARLDPIAVRGMTLAQDSVGYYAQTLRTALELSDSEAQRIDATLSEQGRLAGEALGGGLDATRLRSAWDSLWTRLARDLPQRPTQLGEIRRRLEPASR